MEFDYDLSEITLEKISSLGYTSHVLCNDPELSSLISQLKFEEPIDSMITLKNDKGFKSVQSKAKELLSRLPYLGQFKHMILETLWSVTIRTLIWKCRYAKTIDGELLQRFFWTKEGRIDSKATAKYIIVDERITITKRFALACIFFLEVEITEMWNDLSYNDRSTLVNDSSEKFHPLICFWIFKLTGRNPNWVATCFCAVQYGLVDAIKYFIDIFENYPALKSRIAFCTFGLLTRYLTDPMSIIDHMTDVGYFLLSQMNEREKNNVFNHFLFDLLLVLLYTPGQNEFLNVFKDKLSVISRMWIICLFLHICFKIHVGVYFDYEYIKIIDGMWEAISEDLKRRLRTSYGLRAAFCEVINENFRILLIKNPSKKYKKSHILANRHVLNQDKWKLLLFYIKSKIVTTEYLKDNKTWVLKKLHIKKSNRPAWIRLMMFVKQIASKKDN